MRKLVSIVLALTLCLSSVPVLAAQSTRDLTFETQLATQLKSLGLFLGVGENKDGSTNFDLKRQPTRVEAVVMLLRALGKATEAEATPKSHPFTDVPKWANGYISYAYAQGLTKGVSQTKFGANDLANSDMYLTFMLRALGYTEGSENDFTWDAPEALSSYCGILPLRVDTNTFLRADVVSITTAALYAKLRGTDTTLQASLATTGLFTPERFQEVFPSDPFADFHRLEQAVSKAIGTVGPLGLFKENVYGTENHRILTLDRKDGSLHMTVLVCYIATPLGLNTYTDPACTIGIALWEIILDETSLALQTCRTAGDIREAGLALTDVFSQECIDIRQAARNDMYSVCALQEKLALARGDIAYKAPTLDSSVAKAKASLTELRQTFNTQFCTVLFGSTTEGEKLFLIYPPSETVNEATTVIVEGRFGGTLRLSDDGLTLYYSYFFDNANLPQPTSFSLPAIKVGTLPTSGTVHHYIDLKTGYGPCQITTGQSVIGDRNTPFEQAVLALEAGDNYSLSRLLETPYCTLLLTTLSGTPHGSFSSLHLLYKAGSSLGEGTSVYLPIPDLLRPSYKASLPKEILLSPDGLTLSYQFYFEEDIPDWDEASGIKAGTYLYSVDLPTGKLTETFTPK